MEVDVCDAHLPPLPDAQPPRFLDKFRGPASLQEGEAHLVSAPREAEFGLLPTPINDKCV